MKAKETIISACALCSSAISQADISFRAGYKQGVTDAGICGGDDRLAGIREVVEWLEKMKGEEDYTDSNYQRRTSILLDKDAWQRKLEEWGIK